MTAVNHAMANRVADALLENLLEIGREGSWRTKPLTVARGIMVDAQSLPKPALFLVTMGWGPMDRLPRSSGVQTHRASAEFRVLCLTNSEPTAREAEQELNNLAADVIACVERDYQLGDGDEALLVSGFLKCDGYRPEIDMSAAAGYGIASVGITATWMADENNP